MSANSQMTSFLKWFRFFNAMSGTPARRKQYVRRKIKYTLMSKALGKQRWMR